MRLTNFYLAGNAFVERLENPLTIKSFLLFGAIIVLFVVTGIAINFAMSKLGEKKPQNLDPFYEDEVLETKKLERTLAIALISAAVVAVAIGLYYVWEPTRQAKMTTAFDTKSVRRGQTFYANEGMFGYDNVQSLGCANCHGGFDPETGRYANGGSTTFTLKALKDPETDEACAGDLKFTNPDCITTSVSWEAPALNTILYKYPIRKAEPDQPLKSSCRLAEQRSTPNCRSQVYDILVYGRPGTPMPAWGVAGGGPKNEQAIDDLISFLASIQLPADEAAQPIRSGEIIKQKKKIAEAKEALKEARSAALETGSSPEEVDASEEVKNAQAALDQENAALKAIESKTETQYIREAALAKAAQQVDTAQKALDEAPSIVASAQAQFNNAVTAYRNESALSGFSNPQEYLDKLEADQTEIKIEKRIEDAKAAKNKKKEIVADKELQEVRRLKNIAQNFLETRDALATANATLRVFAPEGLKNAQARLAQLQSSSEGELLFEYNCARCHTKGWSYFTPENARVPLPAPQGTGAFGPNLANGEVVRQFVTSESQYNFIAAGSIFQAQYGERGVGTGRMPAFNSSAGRVLTDDQINAIVTYERVGLSAGKQNSLGVRNLGSGTPPGVTTGSRPGGIPGSEEISETESEGN